MTPGLLVLHGNQVESLARAVMAWLAAHPLPGLQEEIVLVPSIGMAEWFKMELAQVQGICAATRVELPARFLWRSYRAVLGAAAVPRQSALDKLPASWRLMQGMPGWLQAHAGEPGWAALEAAWGDADAVRRLQWAQRVADLFDQYQVYRSDWLDDWEAGHDRLSQPHRAPPGNLLPVPDDQRWQPALWRALLQGLNPTERVGIRAHVHRRFVAQLQGESGAAACERLPSRLVLFGSTHLPQQTFEALVALSAHRPVLLAVPNPCRFHWADLIEGREWLAAAQRRHPLRQGRELAQLPLESLHAYGHPLLAAWGRQARDFIRQLDAVDETAQRQESAGFARVDLFEETPGDTLLAQVQACIRDLVPLAEHAGQPPPAAHDRSIAFHVAHSAQREVEILHDQLLHLLAHPPGGDPLQPRDIVVMVPDIDTFAPAIRAVFGGLPRHHPRYIPWSVVDLRERGHHPVLVALEWLLRIREQRVSSSELRDLLDVPAIAARVGLPPEEALDVLRQAEEAGARWGLHAPQREALGLPGCEGLNTWRFALQRLLLGFAAGASGSGFDGLEPQGDIGGLEAGDIGLLDVWLRRLQDWWTVAGEMRQPQAWAQQARDLLQQAFVADDTPTRSLLAALDDALSAWLEACASAGFNDAVGVEVLREAWLASFDEPGTNARFKAGGVTFATLLPLRAIPFEVVCLLGMNEGDYPRQGGRNDMDLMALPGAARAGDRSRRHDDRQLMLDALLAARRTLYISWVGRSVRDNQPQPPSALVAQLRDYLDAGWGSGTVAARTSEHPLQPFSRRYFEQRPLRAATGEPRPSSAGSDGLLTYATEWREALQAGPGAASGEAGPTPGAAARSSGGADEGSSRPTATPDGNDWDLGALTRFVTQPVTAFMRTRLQVELDLGLEASADEEPFDISGGLARWALVDAVCREVQAALGPSVSVASIQAHVAAAVERLRRAGALPLGRPGAEAAQALAAVTQPMLIRWHAACEAWPQVREPLDLVWPLSAEQKGHVHGLDSAQAVEGEAPAGRLVDVLDGLRAAPDGRVCWIEWRAGRILPAKGKTRRPLPRSLVGVWLRSLALAAQGIAAEGLVIAADSVLQIAAVAQEQAAQDLAEVLALAQEGLRGQTPLATARDTALAWLEDPARARAAFDGNSRVPGERGDPALARWFPDFSALVIDPHFESHSRRLYEPYRRWLAESLTLENLPGAVPGPTEPGEAEAGEGDD